MFTVTPMSLVAVVIGVNPSQELPIRNGPCIPSPTAPLLDIEQPVITDRAVATFWRYLPQHRPIQAKPWPLIGMNGASPSLLDSVRRSPPTTVSTARPRG